jgi:hypothetical protein
MTTADSYEGWIGRTAVDRTGDRIGVIADIYYDDATNQPEWIAVKTGLLGTRSSFVPLHGAESDGEHLRLPFEKAQVRSAPSIDVDGSLTPDEERTLYEHYGRGAGAGRDDEGPADLGQPVVTGSTTTAEPTAPTEAGASEAARIDAEADDERP